MTAVESRVAPTQRVSADALAPAMGNRPSDAVTQPAARPSPQLIPRGAPSSPPGNYAAATPMRQPPPYPDPGMHPANSLVPTVPTPHLRTNPPALRAEASISMAAKPPRRTGLIIAILLVDIGLAIAGGMLLSAGLRDGAPRDAPAPVTEPKATKSPVAVPSGSATTAGSAGPSGSAASSASNGSGSAGSAGSGSDPHKNSGSGHGLVDPHDPLPPEAK